MRLTALLACLTLAYASKSAFRLERHRSEPVTSPEWRQAFRLELAEFRKALVSDIPIKDRELPAGLLAEEGAPLYREAKENIRQVWTPAPCSAAGYQLEAVEMVYGHKGGNMVVKAYCQKTRRYYAVKFFGNAQDLLAETNFYSHVAHAYLLKPHCYLHGGNLKGFRGGNDIQGGLVLDWFDGISALEYAQRSSTTHTDLVFLASKVLAVLTAIHRLNFVHADLKPGNILVNPMTEEVRIIDFGFSLNTPYVRDKRGNPNIIAPETAGLLEPPGPLDSAIDMWAFGSTLATLFAWNYLPYFRKHRDKVYVAFRINKHGKYFTVEAAPLAFPQELRHFLYLLFEYNPTRRRFDTVNSLLHLREHPFFKSVKW